MRQILTTCEKGCFPYYRKSFTSITEMNNPVEMEAYDMNTQLTVKQIK